MPSSTPSSVARYRPAILVLTGAAAAYAAFLVYSTLQASPTHGVQRSNAVRRRSRTRDAPPARALSLGLARHEPQTPALGDYSLFGTLVPLSPHELITATELRGIIARAQPDASPQVIASSIASFYDTFLDRLLLFLFHNRPTSPPETEAVRGWVGDRIPDDTAVARAAERHAHRFPLGQLAALDGAESVAPTELSWGTDEDTEGDMLDPHGQTLQRTLYHIAEDRARHDGVVHRGITCNACDEKPIRGVRWHCANCVDFDLCSNCEATNSHYKTHMFYKIRVPAPYLGLLKQEPLYPGKPHMMSPSIDPALKKRLVADTNIEAEEIEGLWDQFSCLAGTEWPGDLTGVGWALDRRAFNHAFVPRYHSFSAAPNLIYDRIFAYYDTDRNGLIGFDEWIKGLDGMHTTDVEVKARIVFNGYDIDGDGYISRKDILRIFRAYYSIEKEATRNYVAEMTEELSVRNAMDTIRSSQPLGSAFPPNNMAATSAGNLNLTNKQLGHDTTTSPLLENEAVDIANREDMLRVTDLRSLAPGDLTEGEQVRIIADRWARRQFYLDEEEGLRQPEGAWTLTGAATTAGTADATEATGVDRLSMSRSSSRVRFQDDTDMETRVDASTSSRPVGERWGGYEIPEPEKDLGKEVLYQITQQGFNELLNPLFQEKEDLAMDAYETRSERRKHAAAIDELLELFKLVRHDAEAIARVGMFRYSKSIVENLCKALNKGTHHGCIKDIFHTGNGSHVSREEARSRLTDLYAITEAALLNSIKTQVPKASGPQEPDSLTLWNTMLCMYQLHDEILDAILDCISPLGWIAQSVLSPKITSIGSSNQVPFIYRDPTMPQFRPNSTTEDNDTWNVVPDTVLARDGPDVIEEPLIPEAKGSARYHSNDGMEHVTSDPQGPFFVFTIPEARKLRSDQEGTVVADDSSETVPPHARATSGNIAESTLLMAELPLPAVPSTQDNQDESGSYVNWRAYTDNPYMYVLRIDTSSETDVLRFSSRPAVHSSSPLTNPLLSVQRHIRQLAMNSESRLHLTMLTSLEIVEQEIGERKGGGLITFDEFAEHMRLGELRFLESWMEWVSI